MKVKCHVDGFTMSNHIALRVGWHKDRVDVGSVMRPTGHCRVPVFRYMARMEKPGPRPGLAVSKKKKNRKSVEARL